VYSAYGLRYYHLVVVVIVVSPIHIMIANVADGIWIFTDNVYDEYGVMELPLLQ
jgi:hypothetical protein